MWLYFVCRQNYNGTLCFFSGLKSNVPTDPDYVPSVDPGKVNAVYPGSSSKISKMIKSGFGQWRRWG